MHLLNFTQQDVSSGVSFTDDMVVSHVYSSCTALRVVQ